MPLDPGLHENLPLERYLELPMPSASTLYTLHHKSPWHARHWEQNTTAPMSAGSLLHARVLEPDTVEARFYRFEGEKRSKVKKQEWAIAEEHGYEVVRAKDWDAVAEQAGQVRAAAAGLLSKMTHAEVTLVWEEDGRRCKARPDALTPTGCVDLKRARSGHPAAFRAACRSYGHHWQGAWYLRGLRALALPAEEWAWIVCEAGGPVTVYEQVAADFAPFEPDVMETLARYRACEASGEWPGYDPVLDLETLSTPAEIDWGAVEVEETD